MPLPVVPVGIANLGKAEAGAEEAAMRKYPSLRERGTLINRLYRAHAEDIRRRGDEILRSDDWPAQVADQCAGEVHAYLEPGFVSQTGEFSLLPDEGFDSYHVRRVVMHEFNDLVLASDERNRQQHPDSVEDDTPLGRKCSEKAASLRKNQPEFFEQPDWPERLTQYCLEEREK